MIPQFAQRPPCSQPGEDVVLAIEGCYPYVRGGVSSWTDWLIRSLPQTQFRAVAMLGRDAPQRSFYTSPENLLEIQRLHLHGDSVGNSLAERLLRPALRLSDDETEELCTSLTAFFTDGSLQNFAHLIDAFAPVRAQNVLPQHFVRSHAFWTICTQLYERQMALASFPDFFWASQTLIGGLYAVLSFPLTRGGLYHAFSTGYAGLLAARAHIELGVPMIVTEHGIYANERRIEIMMAPWIRNKVDRGLDFADESRDVRNYWCSAFAAFSRTCYEAANRIVTLYEGNQAMQRADGANRAKQQVIPNGVDLARFSAVPPAREDATSVALIGRVAPIKDIKTFISAMAHLSTRLPESKAYIIGPFDEDPEYAAECVARVETLGLQDAVVFTGMGDVVDWLGKVELVVLSSLSEAQPLTILEAGAARRPCVATDVGSCRELIEGKGNEQEAFGPGGLVVPLANAEALADAMFDLLSDYRRRLAAGEALHRRIARYYRSEVAAAAYDRLYATAIASMGS